MKKQRGNQSDRRSFIKESKETKNTPGNPGVKAISGKPVAEKPVSGKPVAEKPVSGKPVAEKPVSGKPVSGKPVSGKPVAEKPVAEKPVAEKPVAEKPVSSKPAAEKPVSDKPVKTLEVAGIKKQYLKNRSACKVTFKLPKEAAPDAHKVSIVGDFNNWEGGAAVMKRLKSGDFTITMELETGSTKWENDWCADRYRPNPFGCDDSVIIL